MRATVVISTVFCLCAGLSGQSIASEQPEKSIDTSRWTCALCPYRFGWTGEIDFGAGWVSDASNKFADYRGLDEEGGFIALDGTARYHDEAGRFVDVQGGNLGIDSRYLNIRGGERGRYTAALGYREIPKYRGYGTQSPYLGVGGNELTLPANWLRAPTTSGMQSLTATLRPVNLMTSRKIYDAGVEWKPASGWSYEVNFQHQEKQGTRPFGAGVFTINASHFPVPVDFSTNRLELAVNHAGKSAHWRLGFSGSEFDNAVKSVTWQNPFTPLPGTDVLRASLEPDNQFYRFDLAGAWAPSPGVRLSGRAAVGRMEQDDALLPYSINPEFSDLPLPRLTADGRVDVGTVDLGGKLTARLARRLDLTVRLDHDERDNKTPVDVWTPVITDFLERDPRPNRPYSFERDQAAVALRYRTSGGLRLRTGIDWEQYERTLQSVAETDEVGWFAEAALSPSEWMKIRARFEHSDRDGEPYVQVPDFSLTEHPLLRKFNLASRDHDLLRLDLDFFPAPEITLNLAYKHSQGDYDESFLGLLESEEQSISIDAGWTPNDAITAYLFASLDDFNATQASAEELSLDRWLATTEDRFFTLGLGITARLNERTELGFDYVHSDADGDIATDTAAGEPPFPTLTTDLDNFRLRIDYRWSDRWGLRFHVEHEKYDSTDWALDGIEPDGIPNILSFGAESPDYGVTVIRVQARYRF